MASVRRVLLLLLMIGVSRDAVAEILVRWDQDQIPSTQSLGISSVVIPANKPAAVRSALARGYRVYVEIESAGFELADQAFFLRNPEDGRDCNASPRSAGELRGTSDRFVLKFVKPATASAAVMP